MEKPLTIPAALSVLLLIVVFIAAVMAFGGNIDPSVRDAGIVLLIASTASLIACYFWHRSMELRLDVYPDILGDLFEETAISELGCAHLVIQFEQIDDVLLIEVLAQNLKEVPSSLSLKFEMCEGWSVLRNRIPPLNCDIPEAAVISSTIRIGIAKEGKIKLRPFGNCRSRSRSGRIRFRRRFVLQADLPAIWRLAFLLTGHFLIADNARYFEIELQTCRRETEDSPCDWVTEVMWTPDVQ